LAKVHDAGAAPTLLVIAICCLPQLRFVLVKIAHICSGELSALILGHGSLLI
jgi:hypothetical protein